MRDRGDPWADHALRAGLDAREGHHLPRPGRSLPWAMRSDPILRSAPRHRRRHRRLRRLLRRARRRRRACRVAQACAMSLLVFTGASQFAVVGVLGRRRERRRGRWRPALLLAARNAIYGLSLTPILRGGHATRAWQSQLVIDESTAMARAQPHPRGGPPRLPGHRPQRLRRAGTSARSPARCSAAASAIRGRSGSTRCSRPRSWRSWPRSSRRPEARIAAVVRRARRPRPGAADARRASRSSPPSSASSRPWPGCARSRRSAS